jgi:hypothetical protein
MPLHEPAWSYNRHQESKRDTLAKIAGALSNPTLTYYIHATLGMQALQEGNTRLIGDQVGAGT